MNDILRIAAERVLFFDGAMGTQIQSLHLTAEDFEGLEGCNELLNATRPHLVAQIHARYFEAGADIVETNTFGANLMNLGEYGIAHRVYELNFKGAQLAREIAHSFTTPDRPRFVAGSIGPGTKLPTLEHITFDELESTYTEQARGLLDGGVDLLLIETVQDLLQAKAAINGCRNAMRAVGRTVPIFVQVTVETTGTMLLGSEIGAALTTLLAFPDVAAIGMNCATGPEQMVEHVRYLHHHSPRLISVQPNAGLPELRDGKTFYPLTPEELATYHKQFVEEFGVNFAGGCCGTTPEHIRKMVQTVGFHKPVARSPETIPACSSLYQSVPYYQENSFLIVGERLNANGSKQFRELLLGENYDDMVQMAREQTAEGANVLDVCVDYVGRDGVRDMTEVVRRLATQSTLPLMVDSTEPPVIEAALKRLGGKCIVNSVNFEDGGKRLRQVLPMCRKYGAAVVALAIDEEGQARTAEWKLRVARRLVKVITEDYGIPPEDIFFDALTFPLGSGAEDLRQDGIATIEAIRQFKQEFPRCHTILGVSNVSFGLKPAARHVLNSVFLHYCLEAGLDAAIVHPSRILPLHRIPEEQREVARQLIFDERREGYDPLVEFMKLFEKAGAGVKRGDEWQLLPVEERLKRAIIEGRRNGLEQSLDEAMQTHRPLDIINNILLEGMKVVGDLFGKGEMQLPFVLQSAEVMKAAVNYLTPFMERMEDVQKGTIVLATVAGDVHDIGKNLVDIILSNNGYRVVNLGIKVPIDRILEAADEYRVDAIGMSGLLVKSTIVMRENLEEMNRRGKWHYPVLLGGAALTRRYVEEDLRNIYKGRVFYGQDAFEGLVIMEHLCNPDKPLETTSLPTAPARPKLPEPSEAEEIPSVVAGAVRSNVRMDVPIPEPPFIGTRVVENIPLDEIYPYINEVALFRGQWQFRRGKMSSEEFNRFLEERVRPIFEQWKQRAKEEGLLQPKVVYGYFWANSDGDDLIIYREDGATEWLRFTFPRQPSPPHKCISDFFRPVQSGERDVVAFHLVTMGSRVSEVERELFATHQYQDYLYLHGLGVEAAEALAEYWHKRVREELGIAHEDAKEIRLLFSLKYQGCRYSFGYPACPNLEDQAKLFELLRPERIGVTLTEEYQLVPEQSTSAIIVHHPEAKYFNIR
ncbi:MAG: methionine synthase [Armatimonadota bacterium]|nr:methionine synthase [Armatimonadota bacterium]